MYINENQPELDWLKTALHECVHSDFDTGDLSDGTNFITKNAERWAVCESKENTTQCLIISGKFKMDKQIVGIQMTN